MRLNPMFCDGAVFQAGKPLRIFGTGGGNIEIDFLGKTYAEEKTGTAWCMELPAMPYGGPYYHGRQTADHKESLFRRCLCISRTIQYAV